MRALTVQADGQAASRELLGLTPTQRTSDTITGLRPLPSLPAVKRKLPENANELYRNSSEPIEPAPELYKRLTGNHNSSEFAT
jgi:hypothetical protein